ncbi:MAG TPA: class I SAM-dependent methyltransferase [Gaiellaceae bacterium]|nr:class I SAM-dependent methyltransferase [Gaiellaceae bacterium]
MNTLLAEAYESFDAVEDAFHEALLESLEPEGPDALYGLVEAMGLPSGARVVDVGCGRGNHVRGLTERFGFDVVGVDPYAEPPNVVGVIEKLPFADGQFDLVWCRDMIEHVDDLPLAFSELRRVLRPGGRAMVYSMFVTELLEPNEADEFFRLTRTVRSALDPVNVERAMDGFRIDERFEIGSQWGEVDDGRKPGQRLLWAARLRRAPERYIAQFGQTNYEVMLSDCLWHVYAMLGKIHRRAYVLTKV